MTATPLLVGISGPSCSGKSTVAQAVSNTLPSCVVVQQDWYFIDMDTCPPEANFCDLRWLDIQRFVGDVQNLANGQIADVPLIDFRSFQRAGSRHVDPQDVILVEGMTVFRVAGLMAEFDLRYYIDANPRTLAARKRDRDRAERGKSLAVIAAQLQWMQDEYHKDEGLRHRQDVEILFGDVSPQDLAHRIEHDILARRPFSREVLNPMDFTNAVVDRLRTDCPYNSTRTSQELVDAIRAEAEELRRALLCGASWQIQDELGDVLFCFLSLAAAIYDVHGVSLGDADRHAAHKMINRHPYVFADAPDPGPELGPIMWERQKKTEQAERLDRRVAVAGTTLAQIPGQEQRPGLRERLIEALLRDLDPFDAGDGDAELRTTEDGRAVSVRTFPEANAVLIEFIGGPATAPESIHAAIAQVAGDRTTTHIREVTK